MPNEAKLNRLSGSSEIVGVAESDEIGRLPHKSPLALHAEAALNALDETYRTAVLMSDISGMSYSEIAAVLGIAEGTVKSRIFRGRAELARLLGTSAAAPESNL